MSIYTRYFRVTSGPLLEMAQKIEEEKINAKVAIRAFMKEIGAKEFYPRRGFRFDAPPDPSIWTKRNAYGAHMPKRNTAAGKQMCERIKALPQIPDYTDIIDVVGLQKGPVLFRNRTAYFVTALGIPSKGVIFISVPWEDIDPRKLEEYQRERAVGDRFSMELEHLAWQPTPEMEEVKRWEVEREIEEINAQIAAKNNDNGGTQR